MTIVEAASFRILSGTQIHGAWTILDIDEDIMHTVERIFSADLKAKVHGSERQIRDYLHVVIVVVTVFN